MLDIKKQITYWRQGAKEDWTVAKELIENGHSRHGLFFAHLALEKSLKAHVCKHIQDIAPRTHNLIRLAELSELSIDQHHIEICAEMNAFNIEGRYPESLTPTPTKREAKKYLKRAEEIFLWLKKQLKK